MASEKFATARFEGGMKFVARVGSGHELKMDTSVADGGEDTGFSPMELPLVALLGCSGMDVVSILRKMRQDVTNYEISAHGVRAETHPKAFVTIEVEHVVTGIGLAADSVRRAVELSATRYCSVGGMLQHSTTITHKIVLVDASSGERTSPDDVIVGPELAATIHE
ncbi:MAG TPA: OsmC family protein [Ktedonobacterales bacterium]|nr:OsmC family protein [Ktedonobacterales bacterium]